ncbi:MAG: DUF6498-containing protein [Candidatus Eisenbacteria bacterium]
MRFGPIKRAEGLLDVAAFAGTVVWAAVARWEANDLVWALWTSSLVVGYATIVTTIVRGVREQWAGLHFFALAGGVGLLAFFTFHFGMFHLVHGVFLNGFFPLAEEGSSSLGIFAVAPVAFARYWPFVMATLVSRVDDVGSRRETREPGTGGSLSNLNMMAPYKNVVRMHILIFVFAGLHIAGLSRYAIYPVLAFYFFPWGALRRGPRGR